MIRQLPRHQGYILEAKYQPSLMSWIVINNQESSGFPKHIDNLTSWLPGLTSRLLEDFMITLCFERLLLRGYRVRQYIFTFISQLFVSLSLESTEPRSIRCDNRQTLWPADELAMLTVNRYESIIRQEVNENGVGTWIGKSREIVCGTKAALFSYKAPFSQERFFSVLRFLTRRLRRFKNYA